ncbi:EthD domain-containing protein [Marmoricola sp. URHB0036]|uniref:EthD domain-containing protein n=1 Tax=Marmoricola sp. URHB0036 TaxID=1298863 RepID=UPI00041E7D3F|nr:EthD domain-containing protein [Marmoricola sp. URHB0036]
MKLVLALWSPDTDALFAPALRESLASVGVTRLQVNLDDDHIPDSVLRLQAFDEPLTCVVSIWTDGAAADAVDVVRPLAERLAAWEVDERVPLVAPVVPDGERLDGLAQVAFLRRPEGLPYDDWRAHWQGPHTQIAMDTQATFGYVQNRVTETLTEHTPTVAAIVEELFPPEAMHDIHAFYGSDGSDEELGRRMTLLMESVAKMGADHDLDVVATSRYVFDLG